MQKAFVELTMEYRLASKTVKNEFGECETRFVIVDGDNLIVDDAKGYGYPSQEKADKALWFKFGGGSQNIRASETFWRNNNTFRAELRDVLMRNKSDAQHLAEYATRRARALQIAGFTTDLLKGL